MFNKKSKADLFLSASEFINDVTLRHCFTFNALLVSNFVFHKVYCSGKSIVKPLCKMYSQLNDYIVNPAARDFIGTYCPTILEVVSSTDKENYMSFLKNGLEIIDYYNDNVELGYDPLYLTKCLNIQPDLYNLIDVITDGI